MGRGVQYGTQVMIYRLNHNLSGKSAEVFLRRRGLHLREDAAGGGAIGSSSDSGSMET